ncbi:AMP-binding protein [Streptomyces mirabilis]|uniref:AMP-binding protein n=1 Tax=Streptomyces mirabilis TaxID=68239 RepID=UPI00332E7331
MSRPPGLVDVQHQHLGQGCLSSLCRGGTVVLHQSFDPDAWLSTVASEGINYAFTVPTMVYALLDHGHIDLYDTSSLQTLFYGAVPMTPACIAEAWHVFGPVLLHGYGQTESLGMGAGLRKDEHDPVQRPDLLASCGRPVADASVEISMTRTRLCRQGRSASCAYGRRR